MSLVTTQRVCARDGCGQVFTPKTTRRIYCSDRCRAQVSKRPGSQTLGVRAAAKPVAQLPSPLTWDPLSDPRKAFPARDACPDCAGPLVSSPRGTLRFCSTERRLPVPPRVLELYTGDAQATRQVKSTRELDDEGKAISVLAGDLLRRVRALLADSKLHPASADVLTWYEEEIIEARKNRDGPRLAELDAQYADDKANRVFRRIHWWQGDPAALEVPADYNQDQAAEDQAADYVVMPPSAVPALPPATAPALQPADSAAGMTWDMAIGARGWQLSSTIGGCQIVELGQLCGAETSRPVTGGWVCSRHYLALCQVINDTRRPA